MHGKCDVCDAEPAVGVGCPPMVAMSVAYCAKCLAANAHPWSILVANTAICGGLEQTNDAWRWMVESTCKHLGRSLEEFNAAVVADQEAIERACL